MIWVTWRQHRTQAIVAGAVLILFAIFLLLTGVELRRVYSQSGQLGVESFAESFPFVAIHISPLLLGFFVGAPLLSQELEQGTNRLAWTQGITREQWFTSKVLLIAGATFVVFLLIGGVMLWWNQPVNEAISPWATFDANGVVIVFHALFALSLGISLGTVVGKQIGGMALFLPVFVMVRVFLVWLRQHYLAPLLVRWDYAGENPIDQGKVWVLGQSYFDKFGQPITLEKMFDTCHPLQPLAYAFDPDLLPCFRENGYSLLLRYQPVERFWLFQGIESAIFLALTLVLVWVTVWWLKKKAE